jgi:hypothetical protein
MGIKRIVDTSFWTDDKVVDYFTPEDKLFMLYIMTNPHTTQLGIYQINKRTMAFELGYSVEAVSVLLDRFQTNYDLIRYSHRTYELAIKNYLKHSIIKGGKPVEDLLVKEIKTIKDKSLLQFVYDSIYDFDNLNDTVKRILSKLNVNENNNDNDNDVSYHDTYHDTITKPKNKFTAPTYEEVLEYAKSRNREDLARKFYDYFTAGNWVDSKGNKVKNWKQKFITWEQHNTNGKKADNEEMDDREYLVKVGKFSQEYVDELTDDEAKEKANKWKKLFGGNI